MADDRRGLAADYQSLAMSVARSRSRVCPYLLDELRSQALVSLCTAARDYREPSSISFAAFARFRISHDLARLIAVERARYCDHAIGLGSIPSLSIPPEDIGDEYEAAERLLGTFPAKVAAALRLTVLEGLTQKAASERMGCSQREVYRLLNLARTLSKAN